MTEQPYKTPEEVAAELLADRLERQPETKRERWIRLVETYARSMSIDTSQELAKKVIEATEKTPYDEEEK